MKNTLFLSILFSLSTGLASGHLNLNQWIQKDSALVVSSAHAHTWTEVKGSSKTLIIFHGLHESPHFMRNWAELFAKQNYNVLNVRLPGHFEKKAGGLKRVQSKEWIKAADEAYELANERSSEIAVLGYSTGGTLSAYLALKHPDKIKNMFLISPAFALSPQVFTSSVMMNPTGLSSVEFCKNQKSFLCKLLKRDPEFKMMIENGLEVSPQAGNEVQALINEVFETSTEYTENYDAFRYFDMIKEKLNQIRATVAMVNTRADVVIDENLNQEWINKFKGKKTSLMFPKEQKIYHGLMNKNAETAFKKADHIGYNFRIKEVEELFLESMHK